MTMARFTGYTLNRSPWQRTFVYGDIEGTGIKLEIAYVHLVPCVRM